MELCCVPQAPCTEQILTFMSDLSLPNNIISRSRAFSWCWLLGHLHSSDCQQWEFAPTSGWAIPHGFFCLAPLTRGATSDTLVLYHCCFLTQGKNSLKKFFGFFYFSSVLWNRETSIFHNLNSCLTGWVLEFLDYDKMLACVCLKCREDL